MPKLPKSGAVLFAKDVPRIAAFYERVVGLAVTYSDGGTIVLESPHQQLVIHAIPKGVAKSIEIASPPKRRIDLPVKLVFAVASIAAARTDAAALGGGVDPQQSEFEARNFRACDGYDPEGNIVQFRESAPTVAE